MQVTVTGKRFDVGDALRNHVTATTTSIVERYFGKATEAHVVFSRERHLVKAEISVHAGRGLSVQGGGEADDAYIAFDGAAEHIDKRLRRNKRRLRNHHGRPKDAGPAEMQDATAYVLAAEDEAGEDAGEGEPLVIAEMRTRILSLSVSEAVMRLDLADLPALLFRNSARDNLNLVYRRPDGNIGWVDPDLADRRGARGTKAP
ncbi:MAG TPA: ribosome-associated translation inhibitor RaiA [Stellaceae bacterium]|nr:ribosome-associated translation inhibitor RaiA [Stellaceae bacterium]